MLIETEAKVSTGYRKTKISAGLVVRIVKHRIGVFSYLSKDDIHKTELLNKHNFSETINLFSPEIAELIKKFNEVHGIIVDVYKNGQCKILLDSENIFVNIIDPAKDYIQFASIEKERLKNEELQKKKQEEEARRIANIRAQEENLRAKKEVLRKLNDERNRALKLHDEKYKWMGPLQILLKPQFRENHCYRCKSKLYSSTHPTCSVCNWMICDCGACGCQYDGN